MDTARAARHEISVSMKASLLFLTVVLGSLAALSRAADAPARKPNVLFIIADDLNNCVGAYGHPLVKTPNIDRLAARGVRFDRAYCQFPLCGPSRNSFLTGLYPNSTGILANAQIFRQTIPSAISLPQAFRLDGYLAVRIGKLYHYNVPNSIGTNGHDDPGSWEMEINPAGCDRLQEEPDIFSLTPGQFGGTLSWLASKNPDAKHTDGMEAADAEWVLERCAKQKDRPFFLAVGFFRPHTPYVSPASYFEKYPEEKMPVVQGVAEDQKDIPPAALMSHKKEQDKLTDDLRRQAVQAYFAAISFMDAQAGKVLDALDRLGLSDNTIVVFTSDHGYHLGEHGLWQKMSLFENSCRVPMIVYDPRAKGNGKVCARTVELVDLHSTLADLAGLPVPDGKDAKVPKLDGKSVKPLLDDPGAKWDKPALTQVTRGGAKDAFQGYSVRNERYRYTEWDGGKRGAQLFDYDTDPGELKNLVADPAHADTVKQMKVLLPKK